MIKNEFQYMIKNEVWTLVKNPENQKIIKNKQVFRIKTRLMML